MVHQFSITSETLKVIILATVPLGSSIWKSALILNKYECLITPTVHSVLRSKRESKQNFTFHLCNFLRNLHSRQRLRRDGLEKVDKSWQKCFFGGNGVIKRWRQFGLNLYIALSVHFKHWPKPLY